MSEDAVRTEFELIQWIRARASAQGRTVVGIGDDCAVLDTGPDRKLLVTTDMLMDGRHFHLDRDGAEAVGYKALAVNLSDIAAMAGNPTAAVVSVALPRARAVEVAQGLHEGIRPLANRFNVALVGGDTNAWDGPLVISVTVLGETMSARPPVLRSGARLGDVIFVTGPLGGSLLGRHLHPVPRIAEAIAMHSEVEIHALIDISDGIASDLGHILEESGRIGAVLDADALPIHPDARTMSAYDGRPALEHALNDGEDFELCAVIDPTDADRVSRLFPFCHRIGTITDAPGLWSRASDGALSPIRAEGFDHLCSGER